MLSNLFGDAMESNSVATVIISIALMLFLGFSMTRLTKRLRLPNVTAYIVVGILIGPFCLNLVPATVIDGMDFLSDIALAFIAFSTGEFFKLSTLKKNGMKVVIITVLEACLATVVVFIVTYCILGVDLGFSIVLAALASATAPASTVMTIRQTGAHGDFVDTLLQVVALDDVVGLIEYSVAISLALSVSLGSASVGAAGILKPIGINLGVLLLGGLFGLFLKLLMPKKRSKDNRLIISVSLIFAFCGICALLDVSPLLGCMSMGTVYINITNDEKLFKQLNYFTPPILLLFFVRSGLSFRLDALVNNSTAVGNTPLLVIGVVYFVVRIVGKYAGAFLGFAVTAQFNGFFDYSREIFLFINMGNTGPGNGTCGENTVAVTGFLRGKAVGGVEDRGRDAVEFFFLVVPCRTEIAFEMREFFQFGIAVSRKHFAVGIYIDAAVFGLE